MNDYFVTITLVVQMKVRAETQPAAHEFGLNLINGTQAWQAWGEAGHVQGVNDEKLLAWTLEPVVTSISVENV